MNSPTGEGKGSTTKIQTPEVCMTEVFMVLIVTMTTPVKTCQIKDISIYT